MNRLIDLLGKTHWYNQQIVHTETMMMKCWECRLYQPEKTGPSIKTCVSLRSTFAFMLERWSPFKTRCFLIIGICYALFILEEAK